MEDIEETPATARSQKDRHLHQYGNAKVKQAGQHRELEQKEHAAPFSVDLQNYHTNERLQIPNIRRRISAVGAAHT
jgi:hypothetical protein